jgi:hypothetical protein
MDNQIFSIVRAWVFRRDRRHGRFKIKEKYFPFGKTFIFYSRKYKNNWVLCGKTKAKEGELLENWLPKLAWVSSKKHVMLGLAGVFGGSLCAAREEGTTI